jgi:hypothetical protein
MPSVLETGRQQFDRTETREDANELVRGGLAAQAWDLGRPSL